MNLQDCMGYVFICEEVSPEDNVITNINICEKPNIFYVEFDATLQSFGVMNRNHRMYEIENVWNAIETDTRIQDLLKNKSWFGEGDHPMAVYVGQKLTPERIMNPPPGNTSHKILNPYRKGNLINALIQTDGGSEMGMNMARKIIQGMVPRFSARALAGLVNKNGVPTVVVKKLITYDWVFYPSHVEAQSNEAPKVIQKSVEAVNESVVVPIDEILKYAASSDNNTRFIMESFELDMSSLIGFDNSNEHILIKDGGSIIGSKMGSKVRKEITGYLSGM